MNIFAKNKCLVIAEIGINHNGDMALAKKAIEAAAQAGADGVKFQNYRTEDFISDRSLTYTYNSQGKEITESQYDMFKRYELASGQLRELAVFCGQRHLLFASTPTNVAGMRDLVDAGAAFIKIGSDYLGDLDLIAEAAKTGLPLVLSTGMATLGEIDDSVRCFRESGGKDLVLLHCTSAYPTPPEDVNLRCIPVLSDAFGCPAGFSDHTEGISAGIGAAVLGAVMVEKHFTLDKTLPGPDHWFSADPVELKYLCSGVHDVKRQLGGQSIGPAKSELDNRKQFKLSCVAATDLPAGYILERKDIAFRRPGNGLPPKFAEFLCGQALSKAMHKGDPFEF